MRPHFLYPLFIVLSRFVIALYDYNPPESNHLSFEKGTLMEVESINSKWLYGRRIDGTRDWVPINFVSDVVIVDDSSPKSQSILEIRKQSIRTAMILEEELERQRAIVTKCWQQRCSIA
jgi:SH3-like domain-containing protein